MGPVPGLHGPGFLLGRAMRVLATGKRGVTIFLAQRLPFGVAMGRLCPLIKSNPFPLGYPFCKSLSFQVLAMVSSLSLSPK